MKKIGLTIAGSDSSGGAGIQADIKSMEANNIFSMSVITGITAQNSYSISKVKMLECDIIKAQLDILFLDYKINGIKIGALFNYKIIDLVLNYVKDLNINKVVIDPVMVSKAGVSLLEEESLNLFIKLSKKIDALFTPNIDEASKILGYKINNKEQMFQAIKDIQKLGFNKVLLKGGHLENESFVFDMFSLKQSSKIFIIERKRLNTINTHGTGCSLSSAILAIWIKKGSLIQAINEGIDYVHKGIKHSLNFGKKHGPINHFWKEKYDFKK